MTNSEFLRGLAETSEFFLEPEESRQLLQIAELFEPDQDRVGYVGFVVARAPFEKNGGIELILSLQGVPSIRDVDRKRIMDAMLALVERECLECRHGS